MNTFPLERFHKVLAMLSSSNDGERLAALNRAQSMLDAHGLRWNDIGPMAQAAPDTLHHHAASSEPDTRGARQHKPRTRTPRPARSSTSTNAPGPTTRYIPIERTPDRIEGVMVPYRHIYPHHMYRPIPGTERVFVVRTSARRRTIYGPFDIHTDDAQHAVQAAQYTGKQAKFRHEHGRPFPILIPILPRDYAKQYKG